MSWCCFTPAAAQPPVMAAIPESRANHLGFAALITAVALIALGACLASGCFTPGVMYHMAAYLGAGLVVLSLVPLAIASTLLCRHCPPAENRA